MWNGLEKRNSRLEKGAEQVAKARSNSSPDCICFPATEQPFFVFPIAGDIAFFVKCPLHGAALGGHGFIRTLRSGAARRNRSKDNA